MIFRKAVLIIHGYAGGVYDEESLQYKLNPNWNLDVYNFTLPGHESNLSSNIKYIDWIKSVDEHIEYLIDVGYKTIYVVGHSMGGVLATHAAVKYKEVKKVVLAAPAFQYLDEDDKILDKIDSLIKNGFNIIKTYNGKEIISRMLKVSIPMTLEFAKLIEVSQDLPSKLNKPVLIFQGKEDDIVPVTSSELVYNRARNKKWLVYLEKANHDVFKASNVNEINSEIEKFFKRRNYKANKIRNW